MRIYIFNMCRCDQSSSPRRSAMIGAAAEEEQEIIFLWGTMKNTNLARGTCWFTRYDSSLVEKLGGGE